MADSIGGSTNDSTATHRNDVSGLEPASFRYNNPGAQYPSTEAARFGQTGYGIIGGGHKIARFPSPVNGAAANLDLLYRNYTGMTIGAAGTKWTGAYGFGVPGYDPNSMLTKTMLDDEDQAIALLKAIAHRESGRGNNLTEQQWRQAHAMFKLGSADKYLKTLPDEVIATAGPKTGAGLLKRAREHIGEPYRNVRVPKDDNGWKGPWDCAEFVSWLVFQEAGVLYGCLDDNENPADADAYTGAWQRDVKKLGNKVSVDEAASTVGGIVLRYPPGPGEMGHIAICDGKGGTVEAKGRRYGVVADTVHGRAWHTGVLIPGIDYTPTGTPVAVKPAEIVYEPGASGMKREIIFKIQRALAVRGFDPGEIDGDYGRDTQAAVAEYQRAVGLVVDGAVGPETAEALGISLVDEHEGGSVQVGDDGLGSNPLLPLILALLGSTGRQTTGDAPGLGQDYLQQLLPLLLPLLLQSTPAGPLLPLLLPLLLQSTPAGNQIQMAELLGKLLTGNSFGSPTPQPSPMPTDISTLLLQLLGGRR